MRLFFNLLVLLGIFCALIAGASGAKASKSKSAVPAPKASKSKAVVAVPRAKGKGKSSWSFGGPLKGLMRTVKAQFCSELESVTLQMTAPSDAAVPQKQADILTICVNEEYDDPQVITSLLAKFSRKFTEANVFTKIKALAAVHMIMAACNDKAQVVLMKSFKSLRNTEDAKTGHSFFSEDVIEQAAGTAVNVAELEAVDLGRVYADYVFLYMETRAMKPKGKESEKAECLLNLLDISMEVKNCGKRLSGPLAKQCVKLINLDTDWIIDSLTALYETGAIGGELEREVEEVLDEFEVDVSGSTASKPAPQQGRVRTDDDDYDDEDMREISSVGVSKSLLEDEDDDDEVIVAKKPAPPKPPAPKPAAPKPAAPKPTASKPMASKLAASKQTKNSGGSKGSTSKSSKPKKVGSKPTKKKSKKGK
jgi:hypothetical protein